MTKVERERRIFRFGIFELDSKSGELRKEGKPLSQLRDQVLQILLMLLDRPREIVTREELRDRLWPPDTFVDFDHGMNAAVNQLRNTLGDSALNPRFIQTLPRRGYRFIAPVQVVQDPPEIAGAPRKNAAGGSDETLVQSEPDRADFVSAAPVTGSSILSNAAELPTVSRGVVRILFSLLQVMYLTFYVLSLARLPKVEAVLAESGNPVVPILILLIVSAAIGIPVRLYLLAAAAFNYAGLKGKFLKLFPILFPLDELWALVPFLIVQETGVGLAIGITASLLYVPFAQRSLLLMGFTSGITPSPAE